jgi:hypothetical protein
MNIHLKNERLGCKTGPDKGWRLVGERIDEENEGGGIWLIYVLYLYENFYKKEPGFKCIV